MTNPIVPAAVSLAAKRGFTRTFTQTLASFIPIAAIAIPTTGDALYGIGLGVAGAVASAALAGGASYLSIISNGIPKDYADATLVEQAVATPTEAAADQDAAVSRVLLRRNLRG